MAFFLATLKYCFHIFPGLFKSKETFLVIEIPIFQGAVNYWNQEVNCVP